MKPAALLLMSLFSLIFGCGRKKTPAEPPPFPRFPETDHPHIEAEPVALDEGFAVRSFCLAPGTPFVYVLAYRDTVQRQGRYKTNASDARIYRLDSRDTSLRHLDVPDSDWVSGVGFGWMPDGLWALLDDGFHRIDTAEFVLREKIPTYDDRFFPGAKLDEMTFDELRDGYEAAFEAMLARDAGQHWLEWTPYGGYYVLANEPKQKRSAWSPRTYEDDVLEPLRKRFAPLRPLVNPQAETDSILIHDGDCDIRTLEIRSAGTELDYPNYKSRRIAQYELKMGAETVHFSMTDKKRGILFPDFADNLYLRTPDGSVWIKYGTLLYRLK